MGDVTTDLGLTSEPQSTATAHCWNSFCTMLRIGDRVGPTGWLHSNMVDMTNTVTVLLRFKS